MRRALRDRAFVGGLWLNTLPALFFGALDVLVPLRLDDAGYGALAIAAVFFAAGLVEVFVNPVVGRVSDRHGRLLPVRVALTASIVVAAALAFASEPLVVAALVVAASVTFGGFYTPGWRSSPTAPTAQGSRRGSASGDEQRVGGGRLTGPAVGGALAQAFGDAVPYLLCGALCGLTLVAATRGAARLRAA